MKTKTEREAVAPMATIEFANLRDFFAELRKDSRYVDRGIVRVAECRRASSISPVLLVCVVGTAHVGTDTYRVECVCGALCDIERNDQRVLAKMREQRKSLRSSCTGSGFDVL